MPDAVRSYPGELPPGAADESSPPIVLKNGIAALAPVPVGHGAFGQVYLGRILNPLGLLAERILWGEESPRWLGLADIPFEETPPEVPRVPAPLKDPAARERVVQAATRLWRSYRSRRASDPSGADEEFKDWLGFIDPLLREDRTVAVKVLQPTRSPDATGTSGESLRRFIKENELLRRLEHPGIVRRFGLVQDPKMGWCLILEYIEGVTLEEHLGGFDGRRMPPPLAVRMIDDLARAVEVVHSKGIIHRDLKPQNVMVRRETGRAVITDFGIGKWVDETPLEQLTLAGVRLGTPRYMAPEQAAADPRDAKPSPQTDVYQLASLLFEMLSGHGAYEGLEPDAIFARLVDPARPHPVALQDYLPGVSQELEALVEVGRDKDPRARWTLPEFRSKLEPLLRDGGYERRRQRRLPSVGDLRRALEEARVRKKEARWKEHVLERELAQAELRVRIEEVRRSLQEGDWAEARKGLAGLRSVAGRGAALPERLAAELESLEKALAFGLAREEAGTRLARAEASFAAERFAEVGTLLAELAPRMSRLPRRSCAELHERHRSLCRQFEAHRSFLELFAALRGSFVDKIRAEYHKLHALYGAGGPVDRARIDDALRKVEAARKNLGTIDAARVGLAEYRTLRRELDEQEVALRDLRKRVRSAPTASG
jgi:serine/threonine protein kinase